MRYILMSVKRVCVCGMLVKGISEKHCKANMVNHKHSKKHKELMEILRDERNTPNQEGF